MMGFCSTSAVLRGEGQQKVGRGGPGGALLGELVKIQDMVADHSKVLALNGWLGGAAAGGDAQVLHLQHPPQESKRVKYTLLSMYHALATH